MDTTELLIRAAAFTATLYALLLIYRVLRAMWRAIRKVDSTTIARTAGRASAVAERKAASISAAFKQGREQ